MADNFIHKQIGPFSGGIWIVVIGGGVVLAILIKRGMGSGNGSGQQSPILVETVPLRSGGGSTSWNDPPVKTEPTPGKTDTGKADPRVPPKQQPPTIPPPVVPAPVPVPRPSPRPPLPEEPPVKKLPAPTPIPPQKPLPSIPGGGSGDCSGVTYVPPDYAARKAMSTARFIDRAIKLSWSVQNIAAGPSGIFAFTAYLSSPASWPIVNGIRKTRGLRPLTESDFRSLVADLNGIAATLGGKENRLTNAHILSIWDKYNSPFLCANAPRRTGSRETQRTGVP